MDDCWRELKNQLMVSSFENISDIDKTDEQDRMPTHMEVIDDSCSPESERNEGLTRTCNPVIFCVLSPL